MKYIKKRLKAKKCSFCGNTFKTRISYHIYCSDICRWRKNERSERKGKKLSTTASRKASIYKGVSLSNPKRSLRKPWVVRLTLRNKLSGNKGYVIIGFYETENQAALAYNRRAKKMFGDKAILNNIIDAPPHNQRNWDFINRHYFDFFELTIEQIISIYRVNEEDEYELIIKILEGCGKSEFNLINKYRKLVYSILFKLISGRKKLIKKIFIDDIIDKAYNSLLIRIKYGVPVFNFKNWISCYCRYEYYSTIYKLQFSSEDDINFHKKKIKEHEEEMKLLYS